MNVKIKPIDKTLTQALFQCPLCGEEYIYFTEASSCVNKHIHSWMLVQTELEKNFKFEVSNFNFIGAIKDILMKKIKLIMYEVDQYGIKDGVVYETTVEVEETNVLQKLWWQIEAGG